MTKDEYEDFALRYKGCGACFPMYHTLSRFEKMWFSAIQKDVAELEQENARQKAELDAIDKAGEHVRQQINDAFRNKKPYWELEKENTLLKGRNEGFEKQIMGLLIKYEGVYKRFPDLKSAMDKAEEVLKENAELKADNDARKFAMAMSEKVEKQLREENAKLKKKNLDTQDAVTMQMYTNKANKEIADKQLTKAKELLERLLITSCNSDVLNLLPNCSEVLRVRVEAEQFLKDCEVEK